MSNTVNSTAILWAEEVCINFEQLTGVKMLFEQPKTGVPTTTEINFYTRGFEFEKLLQFPNEVIEGEAGSAENIAVHLRKAWIGGQVS